MTANSDKGKNKGNSRKKAQQKSLEPLRFQAFLLARKEGFEPSHVVWTSTPLAGEPLRPLGYFRVWICPHHRSNQKMAERVGFEPTDVCTSPVFKTGSLNHSDISQIRLCKRLWQAPSTNRFTNVLVASAFINAAAWLPMFLR